MGNSTGTGLFMQQADAVTIQPQGHNTLTYCTVPMYLQ